MADLGKTTNGAGQFQAYGNVFASQYTAPASGQVSEIHVRSYYSGLMARVKPAIWADNGSNYPGSLLASGGDISPDATESDKSTSLSATVDVVSGTKYWLGGIVEYVSATYISRDDTGGTSYFKSDSSYTLGASFPLGATSGTRAFDLYCPIVAAAGTTVPVFLHHLRQQGIA